MQHHVVVRTIPRAEPDTVAGLAAEGVSTVHEAMGRPQGLLRPEITPIQRGTRIAGSAVTVLCQAGYNLMSHAAIEVCQPGDILVVTTTSPSTDGMLGELLGTSLQAHGSSGSSSTPACEMWSNSTTSAFRCGLGPSRPMARSRPALGRSMTR